MVDKSTQKFHHNINKMRKSRAILVALEQAEVEQRFTTEESLEELTRLVDTAGIEAVTSVIQKRQKPHPGYFIGKGKAREIGEMAGELDCDMVIFDDELSPGQIRNLEDDLELDVWDRTALILDIFHRRANSKEAKLQVELARLEYLLPRLVGRGSEMSRLAGGIGTRGRGEQKLEIDRRHLRQQIDEIRGKLNDVRKRREEKRQYRRKHNLPVVSLIGYTNAGKSTLLSNLTGTDVTAKDELFNTLDPKLASLTLPSGSKALLSDTVGFINKLPHHLVAAFRATLEEVEEADLILHVIDASSPRVEEEIESVEEVLDSLDLDETSTIKVYNKVDKLYNVQADRYWDASFPEVVGISALKEQGLERLNKAIQRYLESSWVRKTYTIPYHREDLKAWLYEHGEVLDVEYHAEAMEVYARVPPHEDRRVAKSLEEIDGGGNNGE